MRETLSLQQRGRVVLVVMNGELAAALHYAAAKELARGAKLHLQAAGSPSCDAPLDAIVVKSGRYEAAVRHEGKTLLFVFSRFVLKLAGNEAAGFYAALYHQASKAEEWAHANKIARDQAILVRVGEQRFGLTSHPLIMREAVALADGDRDLRRALPGGIKSTALVGGLRVFPETRPAFEQALHQAAKLPTTTLAKILAEKEHHP